MMKRYFTLVFALILGISCFAQQKNNRYAIKSGYVKYELSGSTIGTKEMWWDNYGSLHCELVNSTTTVKMLGMKDVQKTHMLTILKFDKVWTVDYTTNTGTKSKLPYYYESHKMLEGMDEQMLKEFSNQILEQLGGERMGVESCMGHTCDVMKVMGAKIWIYKGVTLKSEAKLMGIEANEKAIVFKPGQKVASLKFMPPTDIDYDDMEQQVPQGFWGGDDDSDENTSFGEEMKQVKKVANMPYPEFKKMMKKENPNMTEEQIKQIFQMTRALGKE